ncbi:MAG: metallophosphoesterase [Candidatus Thalassarchaeaceae archaeon]|nr:metallophosphoesterase [Candidatus Thalassarchaeaceae archaeon]
MPVRGTRERLEALESIQPILEAAMISGMRGVFLDTETLDKLFEIAGISNQHPTNSSGARTIAGIEEENITPAPRPHGLSHYDLAAFPMEARDVDMELEVHFDITGNSITEGRMSDILSCFNDRLATIRKMLIDSRCLPYRPTQIGEVSMNKPRFREEDCTLIGIVNSPAHTKRHGHLRFVLEDEGAEIECIMFNREEYGEEHPLHTGLMPDDVVGVLGRLKSDRGKRDTFIVENIYFPPLQQHEKNSAPADQAVSVAFLSDVHLGSKTFLDAQWHKMVEWFNTDPLARTIRYFVISGDGVDGVGIYPNQEKELAIPDLFNQYGGLAKLLEPLPDWVDVLLLPGNHDAVRPAEPQPALDPELQQDYNNTTFVGNPCDFSLHGVRILSYHGKSIDDFVSKMRNVSYDRPEAAMRAMIDRRHLAPSWGAKTPLSPEPEDNLVIRTIPDIFVTGHVHGHHVSDYKGVKLIHSSTWQDQTGYQRTLGFQPRPAILTVVNLHTHETASIPFA